ncbi:MAG: hypothetical protein ACJ74H_14660 [Thermoanaerobaculia bacterium]
MTIRLHIDRVVLDGVDLAPGSRRAFRQSLERELASRIAAEGIPGALASGIAVPSMSAPAIEVASGTAAPKLGASIAASVYAGIGGGRR